MEMIYVVIYSDSRLNFHKHIKHNTEKLRKMIYMLGRMPKLNWGLGDKSYKTIYKGAFVSLIIYGAAV